VSPQREDTQRANGQALTPDGTLVVAEAGRKAVVAYRAGVAPRVLASDLAGNDLVVAHNGNIYVTAPPPGSSNEPSVVWLLRPDGSKVQVDSGLRFANGIALSPDQTLLYVADYRSHWVYSYQIQPDGTLRHRQRYFHLHEPDDEEMSFADGLKVDREGRLYVATRLGIQICDQAGRVNAIIPTPNGRLTNLCFGGEASDVLYATCGDRVYRRRVRAIGAHAWQPPLRPAPPRL
jgi:sugar lactone lactonase YvrE